MCNELTGEWDQPANDLSFLARFEGNALALVQAESETEKGLGRFLLRVAKLFKEKGQNQGDDMLVKLTATNSKLASDLENAKQDLKREAADLVQAKQRIKELESELKATEFGRQSAIAALPGNVEEPKSGITLARIAEDAGVVLEEDEIEIAIVAYVHNTAKAHGFEAEDLLITIGENTFHVSNVVPQRGRVRSGVHSSLNRAMEHLKVLLGQDHSQAPSASAAE